MAKKNITIGFPEEKLNVLLYFLNREQQNLEPLLEEQLDRLYNRTVPKQTRDFIQFQMTGELATETEENTGSREGKHTRNKGNSKRGKTE